MRLWHFLAALKFLMMGFDSPFFYFRNGKLGNYKRFNLYFVNKLKTLYFAACKSNLSTSINRIELPPKTTKDSISF